MNTSQGDSFLHEYKSPRYFPVILCGGKAKRFGDVKTLGFIGGRPLLEYLIDIVNPRGHPMPTAISVGPEYIMPRKNNKETPSGEFYAKREQFYGNDLVKDRSINEQEKIIWASNAEEIVDYVQLLRQKQKWYEYVNCVGDDSKASCIKNIADCINGKFKDYDPFVSFDPTFSMGNFELPIFNSMKYFKRYLAKYDLNLSTESVIKPEFEKHMSEFFDAWGKNKESRVKQIKKYMSDRVIVALNGDSITFSDVYNNSSCNAPNNYKLSTFEWLISESVISKLRVKNHAAVVFLFNRYAAEPLSRKYTIDDHLITEISDKNEKNIKQEAGLFIFDPKALEDIAVPRANLNQTANDREIAPGLNWLCQQLINKSRKVYVVKVGDMLYDLNLPHDYVELRKRLRHHAAHRFGLEADAFFESAYSSHFAGTRDCQVRITDAEGENE